MTRTRPEKRWTVLQHADLSSDDQTVLEFTEAGRPDGEVLLLLRERRHPDGEVLNMIYLLDSELQKMIEYVDRAKKSM